MPKKFNASWKLIFFGSAVAVVGGSALGILDLIGEFALFLGHFLLVGK